MSKLAKALTAAAGNAGGGALYVEDVFSTYLYTGNGGTEQAIVNNVDLLNEGGLAWIKERANAGSESNQLFDTERGSTLVLHTEGTSGNSNYGTAFKSFNSDGFSVQDSGYAVNDLNATYASWTFRKAEKFFDVVTYTGNGVAGREIAHNLGSSPAFVMVKRTNTSNNWICWHSALTNTQYIQINATSEAFSDGGIFWNSTTPDASNLTLGSDSGVNGSGSTYVAYLFASDAGGFGDDGSESIIKCGSYVGDGTSDFSKNINLGFEPQWVLVKRASSTGNWFLIDTMRGMPVNQNNSAYFFADLSAAEQTLGTPLATPTATGFNVAGSNINNSGVTVIYIAIRRPMKTPESGTEVFSVSTSPASSPSRIQTGFVTDLGINSQYISNTSYWSIGDRLRGEKESYPYNTNAEASNNGYNWDAMNSYGEYDWYSTTYSYSFKRATGFFDVVAYTGDRSAGFQTITHNLKVSPELVIIKARNNTYNWFVNTSYLAAYNYALLNLSNAFAFDSTEPDVAIYDLTETTFKVGDYGQTNGNTVNFIAYLFATLAGVSKVGSYTGTGSNVNVDCGFSAGARFILIKRTDSTGDWYVWDSARGIVAGNDPYLRLNSTAAQVTSTDYIDPLSSGFTVTSSAPAALNASGGNYIFLAIA